MTGHRRRGANLWFAAAPTIVMGTALALLPACRSAGERPTAAPTPAPAPVVADAAAVALPYDWRAFPAAPFGTVLKAIPLPFHEVLLFREDPAAAVPECYAADSGAPLFAGRTPEEYVMCFKRDRLNRVQAAVRMAAADMAEVFSPACAAYLNAPADAHEGAAAQAEGGSECDERDGALRFSARRGAEAGRVCITIDSGAVP